MKFSSKTELEFVWGKKLASRMPSVGVFKRMTSPIMRRYHKVIKPQTKTHSNSCARKHCGLWFWCSAHEVCIRIVIVCHPEIIPRISTESFYPGARNAACEIRTRTKTWPFVWISLDFHFKPQAFFCPVFFCSRHFLICIYLHCLTLGGAFLLELQWELSILIEWNANLPHLRPELNSKRGIIVDASNKQAQSNSIFINIFKGGNDFDPNSLDSLKYFDSKVGYASVAKEVRNVQWPANGDFSPSRSNGNMQ